MRFKITSGKPSEQKTNVAIAAVFAAGRLGNASKQLDKGSGGIVSAAVEAGDIRGNRGDTLLIRVSESAGTACKTILLVGCGDPQKFDRRAYRQAVVTALKALKQTRHPNAISYLSHESVKKADPYRLARLATEAWHSVAYTFSATKSNAPKSTVALKELGLAAKNNNAAKAMRKGLKHGEALAAGMSLTQELGNMPANICTPSYLVKESRALAKQHPKLSAQILDEADMKKLGMGSLLSVTSGTVQAAKFIVLKYKGSSAKKAPIVLIGKGITFDAGGISLKPPAAMDEMKYDMSGAATVLGVMNAVIHLNLSVNLNVLVPACENLPGGAATKPGDVVTSMSGQTIEVLNTDAEGRLVLCDAITYSERFKPAAVIDVATLTGACVIALGSHRSGLLANSDSLANQLLKAGENADDRAWRLPLGQEYMDQLKSNFADVANVGGREAGTITAACFLSRFADKLNWAHLDIAGTAWRKGARKGSSGRPVALLLEYLLNS
ncbi:MAG: leucyl aminopeptidase [Gammaproteobacteria bacterium]